MRLKANDCLRKSMAGAAVAAMLCGGGMAVGQDVVEAGQTSTLTVSSRLVVLDVVVVDKDGHPVTTLDESKFRVYEDKIPQTIKNFDAPTSHQMPAGTEGKMVVQSAADLPKIGQAPVDVLVFDELNTPYHDLSYAREQMMKYLLSLPEVLPAPTLFVAAGNTKMAVLHDYTQSRAELIESVKKHTSDIDFTAMMAQLNGGKLGKDDGFVATLGAMSQIAESVKGVPGRKNVIWIGQGYNNASDLVHMSQSDYFRVLASIEQVTDRMLAARATLYVIDPEGPAKVDDPSEESIDQSTPGSPASDAGDYGDNLGFYQFSQTTGGRVIGGRNDLGAQVGQVSQEGTEYYTLSYVPANMDTTGKNGQRPYRKIKVMVTDPGLRVMTREGYFAGAAKVSAVAVAPRAKQAKDVQYDLLTAARTTLAYTGLHTTVQRTKKGYTLLVNANDLQFNPQPDGTRLAEVTVVAVSYNTKGKESSQKAMELKEELGPNDRILPASQVGFDVPMVVPPFTQRVRFVIRDASTGTMGSAEGTP